MCNSRDEAFGESLRDQLNRQLAMIDPFLTFSWADWKNVAIFVLQNDVDFQQARSSSQ